MSNRLYFDADNVGQPTRLTREAADDVGEVRISVPVSVDYSTETCAVAVAELAGVGSDVSQDLPQTHVVLEQSLKNLKDADEGQALSTDAVYSDGFGAGDVPQSDSAGIWDDAAWDINGWDVDSRVVDGWY